MTAPVGARQTLLVALTRLGPGQASGTAAPVDLEAEVAALAPALGLGIFEARQVLSRVPPVVLLATGDAAAARALLALVRGRGHGAVACDASAVTTGSDMASPRELRFESDRLVVESPAMAPHAIAYADVMLIAEATHAREEEKLEERTESKLSLGRAVLSGGLIRSKSTTVTSRAASEDRERVIYVMHARGGGHVLLRELRLRYGGLGARAGRTVAENFATLRAMLVEHTPGARFDDRLVRARRAAGALQVTGTSTSRTFTASNAGETDLAVHLLAVAHLQGQL